MSLYTSPLKLYGARIFILLFATIFHFGCASKSVALRNTAFSKGFSFKQAERLEIGDSTPKTLELLGVPYQATFSDATVVNPSLNYSLFLLKLREERKHCVLQYSYPKNRKMDLFYDFDLTFREDGNGHLSLVQIGSCVYHEWW